MRIAATHDDQHRTSDHWNALTARIIRGDNGAFHLLFSEFNSKLERYFARLIGPGMHVQDLTQEVWMRVINLRQRQPRSETDFRIEAFLFRVARNLAIDHLRTRKDHASIGDIEEGWHPRTEERERSDAEELVSKAFTMLSDDFKEVLTLHLELGYRLDEIATLLGKSPDAIWARASRARTKLRHLVVELAEREGINLNEYVSLDRKKG